MSFCGKGVCTNKKQTISSLYFRKTPKGIFLLHSPLVHMFYFVVHLERSQWRCSGKDTANHWGQYCKKLLPCIWIISTSIFRLNVLSIVQNLLFWFITCLLYGEQQYRFYTKTCFFLMPNSCAFNLQQDSCVQRKFISHNQLALLKSRPKIGFMYIFDKGELNTLTTTFLILNLSELSKLDLRTAFAKNIIYQDKHTVTQLVLKYIGPKIWYCRIFLKIWNLLKGPILQKFVCWF